MHAFDAHPAAVPRDPRIGFIVSPAFLTADNLIGVAQQSTELSLLVLATTFILICGRMDLSLESTIGVAPVIAVWLVLPSSGGRFTDLGLFPEWMAVPLCLLVGAAIGAVDGWRTGRSVTAPTHSAPRGTLVALTDEAMDTGTTRRSSTRSRHAMRCWQSPP